MNAADRSGGSASWRAAYVSCAVLAVLAIVACGPTPATEPQPPSTPPARTRDGGTPRVEIDGGEPNIGPTRIYDAGGDSFEAETAVAVSTRGDVVVAWMADTSAGSRIGYAVSRDRGATWGAPELVLPRSASRLVGDPVLAAMPSGEFLLAWVDYLENDSYQENLFAAKLARDDRMFGNRVTIAERGSYDKPWLVSTASGTAIVAYGFGTADESGIAVARSPDGETWNRVVVALDTDNESYNFARPCAAPMGDRVYLAYLRMNASDRVNDVRLVRSDDRGATWPVNTTVSVPTAGESLALEDTACVATNSNVWVSYGLSRDWSLDLAPRLSAVQLARSSDQGRSFDLRLSLRDEDPSIAFMHPQIAVDDNDALHVVYYEGHAASPRDGKLRRSRVPAGGAAIAEHATIDERLLLERARDVPNWLGDYFGVVWSGGSLFTAYAQNADGSSRVAFVRENTLP